MLSFASFSYSIGYCCVRYVMRAESLFDGIPFCNIYYNMTIVRKMNLDHFLIFGLFWW